MSQFKLCMVSRPINVYSIGGMTFNIVVVAVLAFNGNREQHLHAVTIETCLDKTKAQPDLVTHCNRPLVYPAAVNLLGHSLTNAKEPPDSKSNYLC